MNELAKAGSVCPVPTPPETDDIITSEIDPPPGVIRDEL
jgi:hypothetical protein